ncbi:unnamed protein product [Trifolium pratense]|uniref:Uncharacterized protein n=1 Tax=Trifolium pratense TaxID=57577 RepID=A0ACB0IXW7_TRIPR|nr:unnamed protein product [Trifolium pratense]
MKDTSKVIIVVTLAMVITLAFVIALILVLLAELYCSLLLRRHKNKNTNTHQTLNNTKTTLTNVSPSQVSNFSNIYSQGVLQAPRNILFPKEQQQNNLHHQVIHIETFQESLISSPTLSMSHFTSRAPPQQQQQQPQKNTTHEANVGEISCLEEKNQLVYISNPIYENEDGKESGLDTPFETPNSSPSHLEKSDSSCDDVEAEIQVEVDSPCYTPPLTPMKKLDAEACSVSLIRSLGTTNGSDSIISRSVNGLSSSSSVSASTSPSW